ncbi:hypothetical protein COLO4_16922 [Corchorus olitorius]|uniref:F-box associated beta-propeller type 1 domain-containing protein n=1 Tax=Corchorus olitorius TaxID=93759 RepID=A0A1R3JF82_9ROSI|nr:hypothetical protein COLO4_16922 [Corchorus olitorius]
MDASSKDYKVLVIRRIGVVEDDLYAIYRMSSDSWRVLKEEEVQLINNDQRLAFRGSVCVNGVFYWQGLESKLLAFHLDTEVFEFIPSAGQWGNLMALHDGRLASWEWEWDCRDYFNTGGVSLGGAVWVMNGHGGNWTKLFNIAPPGSGLSITRMYGFWTHGKVFVEVHSDTRILYLYDIETGEICELGFEGCPWVFYYEESLLAVSPSP